MKHLIAALSIVFATVACAPGTTPSPSVESTPTSQTISGTLKLYGRAAAQVGGGRCSGTGGYDDIDAGTQVRVSNEDGTLIGTGHLEEGELNLPKKTICTFPFVVEGIPNAAFYSIEVSHRGELTYSAAELAAKDWTVAFTLGN